MSSNEQLSMATKLSEFSDLFSLEMTQQLKDGDEFCEFGCDFVIDDGLIRQLGVSSTTQQQTGDLFGYLWQRMEDVGFGVENTELACWDRARLDSLFPGHHNFLDATFSKIDKPLVLDAGCGNGQTGMLFFEKFLSKVRYLAVDISEAVDIACEKLNKGKIKNFCIQCDLNNIPIKNNCIDIVFCPHVLQHTDSIKNSIFSLFKHLKDGGFAFLYCTKPSKPIRQLSDDFLRDSISKLPADKAFEQLSSLTKLGRSLSAINEELVVEEGIELLGIEPGRYAIQTFIFDFFLRAYFRPEMSFDLNKIYNLDWFGPKNYHGVNGKEFVSICRDAGFEILQFNEQFGSTSVIAKK